MKKQPVLITNAARSQEAQLRSRQVRYVTMMSIRAACLVLGGVLISARVPLLAFWLVLCVLAMVFLPWAAVLIANDRPPKSSAERAADAAAREDVRLALAPDRPVQAAAPVTIDSEVVPEAAPEKERHVA